MKLTEQEIFNKALQISDLAQRLAFVRDACSGDEALFDSVTSLLANDSSETVFVSPVAGILDGIVASGELITAIGQYTLGRWIGGGGTGDVYLAQQSHPFSRMVAVKLLRSRGDRSKLLARFDLEKQALALMEDPHIARIYDAGVDAKDTPFLVMEYVDGVSISDYCQRHGLSARSRVEIFLQVCRAIRHAHSKGILHRDIKPSNVLVTTQGTPTAKVIDFGLAKLLDHDSTAAGVMDRNLTATYEVLFTAAFCSPEHVSMGALKLDERSDIYSLGALLYHMLTGATIRENCQIERVGFDEVRRIILATNPLKPSRHLQSQAKNQDGAAAAQLNAAAKEVRGGLDAIVMRMLEQNPADRYARVDDLMQDLQAWLEGKPIARPRKSILQRFRQWWKQADRRWKYASAVVGLAAVTFIATAVLRDLLRPPINTDTTANVAVNQGVSDSGTRPTPASQPQIEFPPVDWAAINGRLLEGGLSLVVSSVRQAEKLSPAAARGDDWRLLKTFLSSNLSQLATSNGDNGTPYSDKSLYHTAILKTAVNPNDGIAPVNELLAVGRRGEILVMNPDPPHHVLGVIKGDQGELNSIVPSPDGRFFATCGDDGTVVIYDSRSKQPWNGTRGRFSENAIAYQSAWSSDGKQLAAISDVGELIFWRVDEETFSLREHLKLLLSDKAECIVANGRDEIALCGRHGYRSFTRFPTLPLTKGVEAIEETSVLPPEIREFRAKSGGRCKGLAMSKDGNRVAIASEDGTVSVFDIRADPILPLFEEAFDGMPISVEFMPAASGIELERTELAVGMHDGRMFLINLRSEYQTPLELIVHNDQPDGFDGDYDGQPAGDWTTRKFSVWSSNQTPIVRSSFDRIHCRRTFELRELDSEVITQLIQQPTGDFYAIGNGLRAGDRVSFIAHFTAVGGLSDDFGNQGIVLLDDVSPALTSASGQLAVDASTRGDLVFSWVDVTAAQNNVLKVMRLTPQGALVSEFGDGGVLSLDIKQHFRSIDVVTLADDGTIAVIASAITPPDELEPHESQAVGLSTVSIWKLNGKGQPEPDFGSSGQLSFIAPPAFGKVVAARLTEEPGGRDLAIAATLRDGTTLRNGRGGVLLGIIASDGSWRTNDGNSSFIECDCENAVVKDVLEIGVGRSSDQRFTVVSRIEGPLDPTLYLSIHKADGTRTSSGVPERLSVPSHLSDAITTPDSEAVYGYCPGVSLVARQLAADRNEWELIRVSNLELPGFVQIDNSLISDNAPVGTLCGGIHVSGAISGLGVASFGFRQATDLTDGRNFTVTVDGQLLTNFEFNAELHSVVAPYLEVQFVDGTVFGSEVPIAVSDRETISVDSLFSDDGKLSRNLTPFDDSCHSVAVQPDGKIVSVGYSAEVRLGNHDFFVCRQLPDGSPDRAFGKDGIVELTHLPRNTGFFDVLVDTRGRILVTGMIPADPENPDGTRSGLILCLSPDGRLDQSFGHQGQCFIAPSETMSGFGAFSTVVEHPQGGYVAAGQVIVASKGDLWFVKIDPDGRLDRTFGNNGIVRIDLNERLDEVAEILVLDDGRILGCGHSESVNDRCECSGLVFQLLPNGLADQTFGEGGFTTFKLNRPRTIANSIALQPDQSILLGCMVLREGQAESGVARCLPNGQLDPSFGLNGGLNLPQQFKGEVESQLVFISGIGALLVTQSAPNLDTDTLIALLPLNSEGTAVLDSPRRYHAQFSNTLADKTYVATESLDGGLIVAGHLGARPDTHYFVGKIARNTLLGMSRGEGNTKPEVSQIVQVEPPLASGLLPLAAQTIELVFDESPVNTPRAEQFVFGRTLPGGSIEEFTAEKIRVCGNVVYVDIPSTAENAKICGIGYRMIEDGERIEISGVNVLSAESIRWYAGSPVGPAPADADGEQRLAVAGTHGLEIITERSVDGIQQWRLPEHLAADKPPMFGLGADFVSDRVVDFNSMDPTGVAVRYADNSIGMSRLQSCGLWITENRFSPQDGDLARYCFRDPSGVITGVMATEDGRYQLVEFSTDLKSIAAIDTQVPVAGSIDGFVTHLQSNIALINRSVPEKSSDVLTHEHLLFELKTGTLIQRIPSQRAITVMISEDAQYIVCACPNSADIYQKDENRLSWKKVNSIALNGLQNADLTSIDGRLRLMAAREFAVDVLDDVLQKTPRHFPLSKTYRQIWGAFASDGNSVLTVSPTGLSFTDLRTEEPTLEVPMENCIKARISKNGEHLLLLIRGRNQTPNVPIGDLYAIPFTITP